MFKLKLRRNACLGFNWIAGNVEVMLRKRWIRPTGRTYEGEKRPVTHRSRLLVVWCVRCTRCARCGISSHRPKPKTGVMHTAGRVYINLRICTRPAVYRFANLYTHGPSSKFATFCHKNINNYIHRRTVYYRKAYWKAYRARPHRRHGSASEDQVASVANKQIYLFWLSESFQIPFEDVDW